nr:AfsA-related hotdog domain-containing protein [Planosporangium flavigriseum]
MSVIPGKRALFAVDSYFRDSWEDLCELPPDAIEYILRHHAVLLLKPDAVVGRRLSAALGWLGEQGTVVAAEPVRLDRHTTRVMWQYQWNVASRDRRDLADLIVRGGDSLLLIVAMPPGDRPATVRLSGAKGPAEPARRQPWHLRHRLGNDNFLLNFVHTADEPADLVRELGVLFDAPQRRKLYRQLRRGADATAAAQSLVARLYERTPARDLSLAGFVERMYQRLAGRTGPAVRTLASALEAMEAGLNADWRGLCDLAGVAGVPLDAWDRIVLGTHLMVASESGTVPILAGVPGSEWDRRSEPAILPPGWLPCRPRAARTGHDRGGGEPAPPALRYDQPVPRGLIHKEGIEEVLVTDSAQVDSGTFALAAELPQTHCYLSDLPAGPARFDLMAVLELCRQAFYVVVHRHLGVPFDRAFLLGRLGVDLAPQLPFADQPGRLRVETAFELRRLIESPRPGLVAGLTFTAPDGRPVGTGTMSGSWSGPAEYGALRSAVRAAHGLGARVGPPPAVRAPLLPAASVGRTAQRNVVLAGRTEGDGEGAQDNAFDLALDLAYRGMFDHDHDHLPGMLLMEAARQAAIWTVARTTGSLAGALTPTRLHASFPAMAEVDLPVRCTASISDRSEQDATGVMVSMRQRGATVCRVSTAVAAPRGGRL